MRWLSRRTLALTLGVVSVAYALNNLYQPVVVVGDSMSPTLRAGRVLFVDRTYYRMHRPAPGEVVVFTREGAACIKRVYRGPGELVYCLYHEFGAEALPLLISEARLEAVRQRYIRQNSRLRIVRLRVPEDHVFLVGDNPSRSEDSRKFGAIPLRDLLGRVRVDPTPVDYCRWEVRALPERRLTRTVATRKHEPRNE